MVSREPILLHSKGKVVSEFNLIKMLNAATILGVYVLYTLCVVAKDICRRDVCTIFGMMEGIGSVECLTPPWLTTASLKKNVFIERISLPLAL